MTIRHRSPSGRRSRARPARRSGDRRRDDDAAATTAGGRRRARRRRGGDADYGYLLDDDDRVLPDPRSRRQPDGVHERSRSASTRPRSRWTDDAWTGRQLAGGVIYELHVGTFTPEGTLDAAIERLDHLVDARRRLRRAAAGQRLQRHAQLGLRRRALVRRAGDVRRPGGLPALRRRLPRSAASP